MKRKPRAAVLAVCFAAAVGVLPAAAVTAAPASATSAATAVYIVRLKPMAAERTRSPRPRTR